MNKNLSICIPTFNRAKFLDSNLSHLSDICRIHRVPIYISDNNSSDNTIAIIKKHKKRYEHIYYHLNKKNMGIDRNMDTVIRMSNSKFSWLFSDDDLVDKSSISTLLSIIKNKNPDFILLNHREKDLQSKKIMTNNYLGIDEEIYNINDENLLIKYAHQMTLLSSCVIKTKNWKKISFESYKSKFYIHIHNIFMGLNKKSKIILVGIPIFTKFNGNSWQFNKNEIDHVLHFYYPKTMENISKSFSYLSMIKSILPKIKKISIGTFIRLRGDGIISFSTFPKSYFYLLKYNILLSFIVLFIPKPICRRIYIFYNKYIRN